VTSHGSTIVSLVTTLKLLPTVSNLGCGSDGSKVALYIRSSSNRTSASTDAHNAATGYKARITPQHTLPTNFPFLDISILRIYVGCDAFQPRISPKSKSYFTQKSREEAKSAFDILAFFLRIRTVEKVLLYQQHH